MVTSTTTDVVTQVGGVLTQVQVVAVQNNMRQALMALGDHIADPELR